MAPREFEVAHHTPSSLSNAIFSYYEAVMDEITTIEHDLLARRQRVVDAAFVEDRHATRPWRRNDRRSRQGDIRRQF